MPATPTTPIEQTDAQRAATFAAAGTGPVTTPSMGNGGVGSTPTPNAGATPSPYDPTSSTYSPTGKDVFGNPVAGGTPTAAPINRTISDGSGTSSTGDPATDYLNNFQAPKTADQIAEEKRQQSQGLIDSINNQWNSKVADDQKAGAERVGQDSAISVLSGLAGSTEAVGTRQKVNDANQKVIDADNAQRSAALQTVYSKIQSDAAAEAEQQKQDATASAKDILARRQTSQQNAVDTLKNLAASGAVDFEQFKSNPKNAQVYQYALNAFGGSEDALKGFMTLNKPKDTVLSSGVAPDGHTFYQVSKNPITGAVSTDHFDLGFAVPQGTDTVKLDNGDLMFVPKNGLDMTKPLDGQVKVYKGGVDPLKALQMKNTQLDIQKKQKDLATTPDDPNATANLDPTSQSILAQTGLSVAAFNYLTQGTGALTRMSAADRSKIMSESTAFLNKNGLDYSTFQSRYKAYNTVVQNNIQRFANTQVAEGEVKGSLDNLSTADLPGGTGNVNFGNVLKVWAGQNVNDANATNYANQLGELRTSLAYFYAAQQGKSSADIPDYTAAEKVIKDGFAKGGVDGMRTFIDNTTAKMLTVSQKTVDDANKSTWDLFGVGDNYKSNGGKTTGGSVSIGGQQVPVGSIIENAQGKRAKVNADGSVTPM